MNQSKRSMKSGLLTAGAAIAIACGLLASLPQTAGAQSNPQKATQVNRTPKGYGPEADQPFAGADPDGTGLPWKEPPPEVSAAAKKAPTPHAPDKHIDLTGFWGPAGWGYAVSDGKLEADGKTYQVGLGAPAKSQSAEKKQELAKRVAGTNLPPYKPELVAKVKDLADHQSKMDPAYYCAPKGFPRVGPPTEIVQVPQELVFLYDTVNSSEQNAFRIISTDGRQHDPTLNPSYYGDSVGHWEGDSMVIDATNFVDDTWLSQNGTIHSDAMHVIERLKREGNAINWEISIDDPKVFTRPWIIKRTLIIGLKGGHALEEAPCVEHDASHLVNNDRN